MNTHSKEHQENKLVDHVQFVCLLIPDKKYIKNILIFLQMVSSLLPGKKEVTPSAGYPLPYSQVNTRKRSEDLQGNKISNPVTLVRLLIPGKIR